MAVYASQQKREKPRKSRGRKQSLLSVRQILFRLRLEDCAGSRVWVGAVSGNLPVSLDTRLNDSQNIDI